MIKFALLLFCGLICRNFGEVVPVHQSFDNDAMTLKGDNVSCSEMKRLVANNVTKMYVYVVDTFFADEDLQLNDIKELHIFASTWSITKPVTFEVGGDLYALKRKIIHGDDLAIFTSGVGLETFGKGRISSVLRYKMFLKENSKNQDTVNQKTFSMIDEELLKKFDYSLQEVIFEGMELEKNYFELQDFLDLSPVFRHLKEKGQGLSVHLREIFEAKLRALEEEYSLIVDVKTLAELTVDSIERINSRLPEITKMDDEKLQNSLNKLRVGVNGNLALSKYRYVIDGFRLMYFPFAAESIKNYVIKTSPFDYNDWNDIASTVTNNLRELNDTIDHIDSLYQDIFELNSPSPVFTWKNADVRDKFRDLFEGKKIELMADARLAPKTFNAFKFNTIEFVFRTPNATINRKMNRALLHFQYSIKHAGPSTMRCNNNFYQIIYDTVRLWGHFEKTEDGRPVHRSMSLEKLREHNPVLSPFTLWEIKLDAVFDKNKDFAKLRPFVDEDVNIELHGTGRFLEENASVCNNENMNKFYTRIEN